MIRNFGLPFKRTVSQAQANQKKLPELTEEQHFDPYIFSLPKYWVHEVDMPVVMKGGRNALIAFRGIARSTDIRTTISSLAPALPCGNSLSIALANLTYKQELIFLTANLAAFVFDYVTRQKVGGANLNFFIINQFPIFPPDIYAKVCAWNTTYILGIWIAPRALDRSTCS